MAQELQFGDFTLDQSRYRLQRGDRHLRLEKLPMELLILLVERRGELVSREEIAERLWGKDVFLDVDQSINTAVRKVRMALRDDPEKPRFVETVVGKGYRFVAPVASSNGGSNSPAQPMPSAVQSTSGDPVLKQDVAIEVLPPHVSQQVGAGPHGDSEVPVVSPQLRSDTTAFLGRWRRELYLAIFGAVLAIAAFVWFHRTEYFWRSPIADAHFQTVTDFGGVEQAAALSPDGQFVAFLSDRDGPMDVWVTQVGSGQFHNLTHGSARELVNPSIRTVGFSPDSAFVAFWVRKKTASSDGDINIWAVPTLGGQPRLYLEGVAELDWSNDGSRLAYHTPGPGDPLYISDGVSRAGDRLLFTAPAGLHSHFPTWSPDKEFIYFVQGALPDKLDIWRIRSNGGTPERITSQDTRITYPVLLDRRTLMYLATDSDGSGPSLYSIDVDRRIPHRLSSDVDRYTSLSASVDGRRVVVTLANPKRTLWRVPIGDSLAAISAAEPIALTTTTGFSPRLGNEFLLYVSATGTGESIWKLVGETATELWSGKEAQVFGGPAISPDGRSIAFSVRQRGQSLLYVMQTDGTNPRIVSTSLDLQGAPAWAPDGTSITTAADDHGTPHLFTVPINRGSPAPLVREYSIDPAWAPDGSYVVYSGADIGTTFLLKAAGPDAARHSLPPLTLTRGARRVAFLRGQKALVLLRGDIQHKNLWVVDLNTGAERQLTNFAADFEICDFDISPDGREVVLERVQERSDVVMLDLPRR